MGETKLKSAFLLLLVLVVTWICAAEASGSHGNTNPPPPPRIGGMVEQYYVGHKAREEILRHLDAMVSLVTTQKNHNEQMRKVLQEQDKALHEVMNNNKQMHQVLQGQDKVLDESMQILQETRSYLMKTQYDYEHPRQEAAGQAHIMDEGTGPTMDEGTGSTYKLRFHGSTKSRIYTNKSLLDQSEGRIEIAIYRDGQIITSGPLSSVRVEIVALDSDHSCKGSWTEDDFHRQIQMRRRGQGSVLEGDRTVKLVNGKASLGNDVRFSEGSSGARSKQFVLAARIDMSEDTEGLRVEEAFMQPAITVLVERSEANEKSVLPRLNDKVHRLKEIAKVYSQRLEQDGICTVKDFLKALNKDDNKLRQILKMKSEKSWKVLVGHARECDLRDEHELKGYMVAGENVTLFFNCIHDNVGAEFNGISRDNVGAEFNGLSPYIAKDNFGPLQKALVDRLKKQAYNELDGLDFQYVMKDNRPVKISANDNAAGSSSIRMSGASPRNTSDHHAHAVSQGANCNAAGPSASEPSPLDRHYTHQNQDQGVAENSIPVGDDIRTDTATTDVDANIDWAKYLADVDANIDWAKFSADTQGWPNTPYGPDSGLFTPGGQFQTFPPPEDPTAPSGSGGGN